MKYELAQINVAKMLAPLESDRMAAFVAALDPINELADQSPGFVWRLQDDEGNATTIRVFDDDLLLVNMSVWDSLESLRNFVYLSKHAEIMHERRQWFKKMAIVHLALWWIPAGQRPTEAEAQVRLEKLRADGATSFAFTFGQTFSPDSGSR